MVEESFEFECSEMFQSEGISNCSWLNTFNMIEEHLSLSCDCFVFWDLFELFVFVFILEHTLVTLIVLRTIEYVHMIWMEYIIY